MNSSDRSKDKRSRIARACDLCRRKKVKCHFRPGEPCFNCITYGEKCIFQSETKKRGPPKGYVEELEHKIQQTERLIQQKTGRDNIDELLEEIDVAKANKRKMKEEQRIMRRADSPSYRTFTDLDALHSREWPPGISYDSVFYLGDLEGWQFFSHKLPLDEQRDVKWKGHYIRKFGDRVVLVADDGKKNPSGTKVPGLQWMQPAARPKGIHQYIYWVAGIDQHTSSRLLKIYFANIHPILPVINKREFLRQYRDISDAYPTGELLNAMFGAAARFAECEQLDPERVKMIPPDARWDVPVGWSDHFFDQAQNIITRSANHPTISKIQAIVLTHNQRGDIDSKSSACWLMGGLAIRLAQGLGLNRNCDDWDIPDREKQVRKRVWWALYACDRFQSALHGRPLGIRDEDNDVGYPDIHANYNEVMDIPVEDDEDWEGPRFPSCTAVPSCTNGQVPIYQLFVQFVKLSEILGTLLQGLYTAKGQERSYHHGSDSLVAQLDQKLTRWRFEFPEALKRANLPDLDDKTGRFAPVVASTLLFYFTSLILLHRPFIRPLLPVSETNHQSDRNPSYSSFRICTSAASLGIHLASKMTVHDFLLTPYSFSLYPLLQCCLIHMYNTRNPDYKISAAAKADLETGIALVNRIHKMSSTAQRLQMLLQDVMDNKNIDVTSTPSEIYALHRDLANGKRTPETTNVADISLEEMLQKQQQCRQKRGDAWLSGFLNPSEALSIHPDQEAFTLQQFGFEPTASSGIDTSPFLLTTPATIVPPPINMYNSSGSSIVSAEQHDTADPTAAAATATATTVQELANLAFTQQSQVNSSNDGSIENNIFRNNPDNPFWGVPASFDCTEWIEWNERAENQWL